MQTLFTLDLISRIKPLSSKGTFSSCTKCVKQYTHCSSNPIKANYKSNAKSYLSNLYYKSLWFIYKKSFMCDVSNVPNLWLNACLMLLFYSMCNKYRWNCNLEKLYQRFDWNWLMLTNLTCSNVIRILPNPYKSTLQGNSICKLENKHWVHKVETHKAHN